MERTMPQQPATIRDPAEAATLPSRPKVVLNLFLGTVAGLVLGVAFAFFLEYLDTSVKTMDEVEKLLDLPVLAKKVRANPSLDIAVEPGDGRGTAVDFF